MIPTTLLIHSAGRTTTKDEQRNADFRTSELAAALAPLIHSVSSPIRALSRLGGN
ncbi:MAG: hypothetical protein ABSG36_16125 [Acidimicrobiales bacterium]|jgi:hypothetical protein